MRFDRSPAHLKVARAEEARLIRPKRTLITHIHVHKERSGVSNRDLSEWRYITHIKVSILGKHLLKSSDLLGGGSKALTMWSRSYYRGAGARPHCRRLKRLSRQRRTPNLGDQPLFSTQ